MARDERVPAYNSSVLPQALGLGALERLLLNQQSLALVLLARTAPLEHHGGEPGVLAGAPREGRIAGGEKHKVVEVGTGEAEGTTIAGQKDPRPPAEIFVTFVAARLPGRNEDSQVTGRKRATPTCRISAD